MAERMIIIIEKTLYRRIGNEFPDFDSHLDEIGIIEDGETDEFQPFEEGKESSVRKSTKSDTCIVFLHTKYSTYSPASALANTEQGTAMLLTLNHALASVNPTVLTAGSSILHGVLLSISSSRLSIITLRCKCW